MAIRAVVFDIGDTLWRLEPLPDDLDRRMAGALASHSTVAMAQALAIVRNALASARTLAAGAGHIEPDLAEEIAVQADRLGVVLAAHASDAAAGALGHADIERLVASPLASAVFGQLRGMDLRLGLVSNTWTVASLLSEFVARQGALEHVHAATFSSQERLRKPHPELYGRALRRLGVAAGETLFVGDRVKEDVVGPQQAGMLAALTHEHRQELTGAARPLAILDSLAEVPGLVARFNTASGG